MYGKKVVPLQANFNPKKQSTMRNLSKLLVISFVVVGCALALSSCHRQQSYICGVPVKGTPWELATAIADHGDGTFIPGCVYRVYEDETFIEGWYEEEEDPPYLWLQVKNGQVVKAEFRYSSQEEPAEN